MTIKNLTSVLLEEEREREKARCIAAVEAEEPTTDIGVEGEAARAAVRRAKENIIKRIKGEEDA